MAIAYTYDDSYLGKLITPEIEIEALADVNEIYASFSATHLAKLVPLRAYILICQRKLASPDDAFSTKLATYTQEFKNRVAIAKNATTDATSGLTLNSLSIPIARA